MDGAGDRLPACGGREKEQETNESHRETWYQGHNVCNREREEACVELIRTPEKLQNCLQRQFKQELKLEAKTADKGSGVKRGWMSVQTGKEKATNLGLKELWALNQAEGHWKGKH